MWIKPHRVLAGLLVGCAAALTVGACSSPPEKAKEPLAAEATHRAMPEGRSRAGAPAPRPATCETCGGKGYYVTTSEETCRSCNGSGYAPCSKCGGSGTQSTSWRPKCAACDGTGKIGDLPCRGCGGKGYGKETNTCQGCGGVGLSRNPCPGCSGKGTVVVEVEVDCPSCGP